MSNFQNTSHSESTNLPNAAHDSRPAEDDDDFFDRVLFLEQDILESSQKEGFLAGLRKGRKDGLLMGERYGRGLGEELGFYIGFVNTWLELLKIFETEPAAASSTPDASHTDEKVEMKTARKPIVVGGSIVSALEKLKTMLDRVSLHEPENPERDELLTTIRARFRTIATRLGLPQTPSTSTTQKAETLSF